MGALRFPRPTRRGVVRTLGILALLAVWLGATTAIEERRLAAVLPRGDEPIGHGGGGPAPG